MSEPTSPVIENPWQQLRRFTAARIALGRTGVSLPTSAQLAFQLAHAKARDAVHQPLNVAQLLTALEAAGISAADQSLVLDSAAGDRLTYLQRPDLGRRLSDASRMLLEGHSPMVSASHHDLALVIADGLSAQAVAHNAVPFITALSRRIAPQGWSMAPLTIVRQARVAIGDEIAGLLQANMVVVMIGERPGLSSPDSMGLYLTWMPQPGTTDASRNCISNVRPAGMDVETAAFRLHYLLCEATRRQLSGVMLKDESIGAVLPQDAPGVNFLLPER